MAINLQYPMQNYIDTAYPLIRLLIERCDPHTVATIADQMNAGASLHLDLIVTDRPNIRLILKTQAGDELEVFNQDKYFEDQEQAH